MRDRETVRVAARNNAEWCDIVCRTHGVVGELHADMWTSAHRTPMYYPDAVTLDDPVSPERILAHVDTVTPGCSIKDSFASLNLFPPGERRSPLHQLARPSGSAAMRALIALLMLGAAAFLPGCSSSVALRPAPCPLYSYGATESCYFPDQVVLAERGLGIRPVNPASAVYAVARLRLTGVIVWQRNFHPSEAIGIDYVFGQIAGGSVPLPAPRSPRFLVVTESATAHPSGPGRVYRVIGRLANGKPRYDPWNFSAGNLDVVGNLTRRETYQIGSRILAQTSRLAARNDAE